MQTHKAPSSSLTKATHLTQSSKLVLTGLVLVAFQRPTAKELSRHPFIKKAKRNNHLIDLIDRFRKWKLTHNAESDTESDSDADQVKYG